MSRVDRMRKNWKFWIIVPVLACASRALTNPQDRGLSGTLIVAIPTNEGLVVAADSRSTVAGTNIDERRKIFEVKTKNPTILTITGTSEFIPPPPPNKSLREWVPVAPLQFSGMELLKQSVERDFSFTLSVESLKQSATTLANALTDYLGTAPSLALPDRELCRVLAFQAQKNQSRIVYGNVLLRVKKGIVSAELPEMRSFSAGDGVILDMFGESDYVMENVFQGAGRRHLDPTLTELWGTKKLVGEVSATEAKRVAVDVIRAASLTSESIAIPSGNGIGGPPQVFLLSLHADGAVELAP